MFLSATLTSLPLDFEAAVAQVQALGFTHVDLVGLAERPQLHLEALADSGLLVGSVAVGRGLPDGVTLDGTDSATCRRAIAYVERQISNAGQMGATCCYLVPGHEAKPAKLERFADTCAALADFAAARQLRLCVEHLPGRALPTVAATLEWLGRIQHDNLHLLLDLGHCLISEEDPTQAVVQAGGRLGYVHLDDNDSAQDVHWPLLTGRLTADMLEAFLTVLEMGRYDRGVALELNPQNHNPVAALRDGKRLLERFQTYR
jgi:sugar phosphate isomerase/epimerase